MKQEDLGLTAEQLLERQSWLQSQAEALIAELDLLPILGAAGSVHLGGSFETGLMVWPDLDIEISTPTAPQPEAVLDVLHALVLRSGVRRVNYVDHRHSTHPDVPRGIYLGPDVTLRDVAWQVDLWFVDSKQAEKRQRATRVLVDALDARRREIILQIKQVAAASDFYHRGISSVDIYRAVIDEHVSSVDGFKTYLARSNREL